MDVASELPHWLRPDAPPEVRSYVRSLAGLRCRIRQIDPDTWGVDDGRGERAFIPRCPAAWRAILAALQAPGHWTPIPPLPT